VLLALALGAVLVPLISPEVASASHPSTAPGCSETTSTYSNGADVVIPTGPAVVSSTINVGGAGNYLRDVDVQTFISHSFSGDLDVTLTSPAGTVVTLTTDNGGSNDNVFNGTVWDDDADTGGQVPYTTNNGLASDQAYVTNVVASPLVPEEALGAFIGENPNGNWVLRISDDLAGDGGTLTDWNLNLSTQSFGPSFVVKKAANNVPTTLPGSAAVTSSTITVSGAPTYLFDVNLKTFITHTFAADLDMTLTSPQGTIVTLSTDNGGGNDNVFNGTLWDDDANPGGQVPYANNNGVATDQAYANNVVVPKAVPEEAMAAFIGENPNGQWTLRISDDLAGDAGTLNRWNLSLKTGDCRPRPDGRIQRGNGTMVGNNTYNNSGVMQTREGTGRRGVSIQYNISAQNDAKFSDTFNLRGQASTTQFTVVYKTTGGTNITSQVVGGTYSTGVLAPGQIHTIRAIVTVKNNAQPNAQAVRTVKITSQTEPARLDVVRFITHRA
jgi:subtilisin-like proprotein convertase family protein